MEYKTQPGLPTIGFGTGQLRGEVAEASVKAALDEGYRLIDTGAIYGNETEVGKAVHQSGILREQIIVITKGAHDADQHGYEQTLVGFNASLGRLAMDYVDYYLIHWPTNPEQRRETWRAMEDIQQSGKARAIGVSNYGRHHLEELEGSPVRPAVNELEFHPYIFSEQRDILEYCTQQGIRVIGYSTFANGQGDADPVVMDIASRMNKTPRHILTRWSMQHGVVPLVRSSRQPHIAENINVYDFELSAADMEALNNLHGEREFRDPHTLP